MPVQNGFDYLIQWHLTERCNLRCSQCNQGRKLPGEMPLSDIQTVIEGITDTFHAWEDAYGIPFTPTFNLTGGEPFVRDDLEQILGLVRRRYAAVFLLTNGTQVDRNRARMLADLGIAGVQVSIEGPDDIHDSIRGAGSFDRAVDGIDHLLDAGLKVTVNVALSKLNAQCMMKVVAFASHMGVQRIGFSRLAPCGRGCDLSIHMLSPVELRELFRTLLSLEFRNLEVVTHDPIAALLKQKGGAKDRNRRKRDPQGREPLLREGCAAGVSGITFLSDGTMLPCRRLGIPLGNLRVDSLHEVWAVSPVIEALRRRDRYPGRCGRCSRWENCRGCRAIAYAASALQGRPDYLADDPQCFFDE